MGLITTANKEHWDIIRPSAASLGANSGPDDVYLALRGLRTLKVRLDRHMETGIKLAQWLQGRPEVDRVLHPALPEHPGHDIWKRDFTGATGLFSFVLKDEFEESRIHAMLDGMELYAKLRLPNPDQIGFRYPHQVSGGQLQRAMTAMAMACRPDLIIFDEPTTALDVTTQIEVLASIRDIVKDFNTAAIYITHDLAVVAQMSDKIKVLLKGDEVETADTRTMLSAPTQEYTKSLWAVRSFERPLKSPVVAGSIPSVSVQNIDAAYGKSKVLFDVSFDMHEGRTVAVVGESGSGKSTVARCITGLLQTTAGQISFGGEVMPANYRKRTKDQLRQVQMIYQMADTALNPRMSIGEIIARPVQFYLGLTGKAKRATQ